MALYDIGCELEREDRERDSLSLPFSLHLWQEDEQHGDMAVADGVVGPEGEERERHA